MESRQTQPQDNVQDRSQISKPSEDSGVYTHNMDGGGDYQSFTEEQQNPNVEIDENQSTHQDHPSNPAPDTSAADHASSKQNTTLGLSQRDQIQKEANDLIEDLNNKRKQDTQYMAEYRKALEEEVEKRCSSVEQNLFETYQQQNEEIGSKLQELSETLERISQLETELAEFKEALAKLYQDMAH